MAFTEFYCDAATGANINAGDGAATVSTTTNGSYSRGTGAGGTDVFLATGGTPFSSATANTSWIAVYADGATKAAFIGLITAVNAGGLSVDISLTKIAGTRPATAATGNSATIGGAWKGPNGAEAFPIGFMMATAVGSTGKPPRVNFKTGTTYAVTAAMSTTNAGPIFWQGYASTPGDLDGNNAKAIIDGGTSGTYYQLLASNAINHQFSDFIFAHNGATGSAADGVSNTATECYFNRCVFHDFRRTGLITTVIVTYVECEAYACNSSNTSGGECGISLNLSGSAAIRCISHDNGTAGQTNAHGFRVDGGVVMYRGISDSNAGAGSFSTGDVTQTQMYSDYYNNGQSGMYLSNASDMLVTIQNCNFVKNARWGIENGATSEYVGTRYNCGFGSGSQANTLGDIEDMEGVIVSGEVSYASGATPWNDPANGDFTITLAAAKNAGRGAFTQTSGSYTGSVAVNSIGSAQPAHASSEVSYSTVS